MINRTLLEFDTNIQQRTIKDKIKGKSWKRFYFYLERDFLPLFKDVDKFFCKWAVQETGRKIFFSPEKVPYAWEVTPEKKDYGMIVYIPRCHTRMMEISKGSRVSLRLVELDMEKTGIFLSV